MTGLTKGLLNAPEVVIFRQTGRAVGLVESDGPVQAGSQGVWRAAKADE